MPSWIKGLVAVALVSAGTWIALPPVARAQDFPCNGTPGEYVVGFIAPGGAVNTSGNGVPLCRAPATAAAPRAPQRPTRDYLVDMPFPGNGENTIDSYIAIASHPTTMDLWVTWNQRSSAVAEQIVLEACAATFGSACEINKSGSNQSIAVSRHADGSIWFTSGEQGEAIDLQALRQRCPTCELLKTYTAEPWTEPNYTLPSDHAVIDARQTRQGYDFPAISRIPPPSPSK
jgi:hypothetical protein